MSPDTVNVPPSELIRAPGAPSVIAPLQVLLFARLRSAPPLATPVPISVFNGSAMTSPLPSTCSAAPLATVVLPALPPKPVLFRTLTVPVLMVVAPR